MGTQETKIIVNALKLIPALIDGGILVRDAYLKLVEALENGVTPEELDAAIAQAKSSLQILIENTEPEANQ